MKFKIGDWVQVENELHILRQIQEVDEQSGKARLGLDWFFFTKLTKVEVKFQKKKLTLEEGLLHLAKMGADLRTAEPEGDDRPGTFWIQDSEGNNYDNDDENYSTAIEALQAFYEETSGE